MTASRRCFPSPMAARSGELGADRQERDVRVSEAEGRQALELLAELQGQLAAAHDGVDRRDPPEILEESTVAACSAKASAKAATFSGAIESPAAARWPPQRPSRREQAPSAPCRSKDDTERPEPTQSSPGSPPAISTTGRRKRSTSREATMPMTPRCQSFSGDDVAEARALRIGPLLDLADRVPQDAILDRLAVPVEPRACPRAAGLGLVAGEQQLEGRAGMSEPPGGVDPGASLKRPPRVDGRRVDAAHAHEGLQAGLVRPERGGACPPRRARGSRPGAGPRRRPWPGQRGRRGGRGPPRQRLEQLEDDPGPAELGEG